MSRPTWDGDRLMTDPETGETKLMSVWQAENAERPHYCYVCGVLLDQGGVREGGDGMCLCPAHLNDLA